MNWTKKITAAALIAAMALVAGCGGSGEKKDAPQQKVALKMATALPSSHPLVKAMDTFKAKAAEKSGGSIEITIYPAGQLYNDKNMNDAVISGGIDMGLNTVGRWASIVPAMDVFDVPFLFPTSAERRQQRGFDIPEAIFAPLFTAKWQGKLLARTRRTAPLYGLPPALRRLEISKCFAVRHSVAGQRILLCDDIYTSGSTLQEAARTLLAAGAAQVTGLAFSASRDNW